MNSFLRAREKKAKRNIKLCINWEVGGLENTLSDYDFDEPEYLDADDLLHDHERLVEYIYDCVLENHYEAGSCQLDKGYCRDLTLLTKKWLIEQIEVCLAEEGY